MNKFNMKLFAVPFAITAVYMTLCLVCTITSIQENSVFDFCLFDPMKVGTLGVANAYVSLSDIFPEAVWNAFAELPNALLDLIDGVMGDYVKRADMAVAFTIIGFILVIAGMLSKVARNCQKKDDSREFMFTTRPHAVLKAAAMPWDIFPAMYSHKYVPVIVPIFFLPFIILFALFSMIIILVIFLIEKAVVGVMAKSAYNKDKKEYDALTQYAVCPKCKRKYYQPNVKCKCGLVFEYPVPGVYGIKEHYCVKGHAVPCNNNNGARSKLNMVCPYCNGEIKTHEARPIVFSMVGAEGSGKTTLIVSAAETVCDAAKKKGLYADTSKGISPAVQGSKDAVAPTIMGELDSECLFVWSREIHDRELVFNDISGKEFEPTDDRSLFQEYYKYSDGFIFAIDPLAVIAFYNSNSTFKSNKTTVTSTLESFYQIYTLINGYGPSVRSAVPMAVVLTKMDNPRVSSAVNAEGSPEAFLEKYGQENFVKIVKSTFDNVKYFSVASLGSNSNAIEPFKWVIDQKDEDFKKIL
ncbi:MAG: GTPase domain-containing protein [Candidatus Methanogranum gryphiswaldense]|nr:MAG: GTPase domain-containing protein [Candidatus Methanogranum sp. U3.2.1]